VGHGFLLPPETEIRARSDRYGHVVVWPGAATYHSLAPGAMRALLGERRFDVAPIMPAEVTNKDELGKRIGIRTRKVDVATRAAKATFEIGRLPDLGEGGVLLCRLLLDLMNAPPQAPVCFTDELPLRVELHWTNHGSLAFELTGILKRTDMSPLPVPPANATYEDAPFPVAGVAPMLTRQELVALRTDAPGGQGSSPDDSLVVSNAADELRVFYIDGVPAVWAAPGARDVLHLPRGRYVVQWRTFLGDSVDQAVTQSVPSLPAAGDAGAVK